MNWTRLDDQEVADQIHGMLVGIIDYGDGYDDFNEALDIMSARVSDNPRLAADARLIELIAAVSYDNANAAALSSLCDYLVNFNWD